MKRIHLFEFEDLNWFPNWIRELMTRYIATFHRILNSKENLVNILHPLLKKSNKFKIIDLCSGGGGPMPDVYKELKKDYPSLQMELTDLYPNIKFAKTVNTGSDENIIYNINSVDATDVDDNDGAIRTMICSMHHMKPEIARNILSDAQEKKVPFMFYEISDNSFPKWIWWIAFPMTILTVLFVTPLVRPMSIQQLVFTYLIPILPICIAWDGAVSNARTYTLEDLDILLEPLQSKEYTWEKGVLPGKGGNKIYVTGVPV